MKKVSCVFGTRPEAIKMAPVVLALRQSTRIKVEVCVTAQHRSMLDQVLGIFDIRPDWDLDLMRPGQGLADFTASALVALDGYLSESRPDMVLVQGDTTTVLCGALAGLYQRVPVAHVEAGLRTGNMLSPWPEEANRRLVSTIAALHFAPTERSRNNLLGEGIDPKRVHVTGNTVIDALAMAGEMNRSIPPTIDGLPEHLQPDASDISRPLVLITGHRRENFGEGFESICRAIAELATQRPEVDFVYPVHLNPNVREPVGSILGGGVTGINKNVYLIEPLGYLPFSALMKRAKVVLSDSGGVQEEAPSLGKPVLVMRDTTERPEAVDAGTAQLVGTSFSSIVAGVNRLLDDHVLYRRMSEARNPYGDGKAAQRIAKIVESELR